ncbi:MAG: sugar phosphate isomerase/epimerase [Clostridiales bacterium]|jgi:sugar phosphate isomerase/epimerase|nr:sugar phosphate isomerase/epimerase [Clostridiales bacterium]
MKIAAQLYTVREFTATDADVYNTLKRVRDIGYRAVQISGFGRYNPAKIREALDEFGLSVCATHTPLNRIKNDTDAVIGEHKLFGAEYVGLGCFAGRSLEDYKAFLADLKEPLARIRGAGLRFLYHNHAHEFIDFNGVKPLYWLRDNTDPEPFGFLPDFYWVQTAGLSPEAFIRDFAGRMPVVHFKDKRVPPEAGKTDMAPVFRGNMDYEGIYAACEKAGVLWACVEQDTCEGDPFDCLAVSLRNIQKRCGAEA